MSKEFIYSVDIMIKKSMKCIKETHITHVTYYENMVQPERNQKFRTALMERRNTRDTIYLVLDNSALSGFSQVPGKDLNSTYLY